MSCILYHTAGSKAPAGPLWLLPETAHPLPGTLPQPVCQLAEVGALPGNGLCSSSWPWGQLPVPGPRTQQALGVGSVSSIKRDRVDFMAVPDEEAAQASGILEEGHAIDSKIMSLLRKLLACFWACF